MTRRTDIHRPSAIVPADYDFIGFSYLPTNGDIAGLSMVISHRAIIRAHMERTGGHYSAHDHRGNCDICGAHCIYTAVFHHRQSNVYIRCGLTCTDNMEYDSGAGENFRKAVREGIEARAGVRKAKALCEEWGIPRAYDYFERARRPIMDEGEPLIPETFSEFEESTIIDIVGKLAKYGSVSDRQVNFMRTLLARIDTRAQRAAQRAEEAARALPVPAPARTADVPVGERIVVVGEIVSTRVQESRFGTTTKMLVKHADGWKVWGTMPRAIIEAQRGTQVEFTAAVTRSDRDEKFGFFSRPTNAKIVFHATHDNETARESA